MAESSEKRQILRPVLAEMENIRRSTAPPFEALEKVVGLMAAKIPGWNWVGIYVLVNNVLRLGPYKGKPTEHDTIEIGQGVCGSAVARDENMIVDDVTSCDNYLACSAETRSEIVVLIRHKGEIVGQFDIDSDGVAHFDKQDEEFLEQAAAMMSEFCAELSAEWGK